MSSSLHSSAGNAPQAACDVPRRHGGGLGRSMELELIPRLLTHARKGVPDPDWPTTTKVEITGGDVDRFVTA